MWQSKLSFSFLSISFQLSLFLPPSDSYLWQYGVVLVVFNQPIKCVKGVIVFEPVPSVVAFLSDTNAAVTNFPSVPEGGHRREQC